MPFNGDRSDGDCRSKPAAENHVHGDGDDGSGFHFDANALSALTNCIPTSPLTGSRTHDAGFHREDRSAQREHAYLRQKREDPHRVHDDLAAPDAEGKRSSSISDQASSSFS